MMHRAVLRKILARNGILLAQAEAIKAAPIIRETVEGVVIKAKEQPSLLQQIVGADSVVLQFMAITVLLLAVMVTVSTGYLTFVSWQVKTCTCLLHIVSFACLKLNSIPAVLDWSCSWL